MKTKDFLKLLCSLKATMLVGEDRAFPKHRARAHR